MLLEKVYMTTVAVLLLKLKAKMKMNCRVVRMIKIFLCTAVISINIYARMLICILGLNVPQNIL